MADYTSQTENFCLDGMKEAPPPILVQSSEHILTSGPEVLWAPELTWSVRWFVRKWAPQGVVLMEGVTLLEKAWSCLRKCFTVKVRFEVSYIVKLCTVRQFLPVALGSRHRVLQYQVCLHAALLPANTFTSMMIID